jgi:hypothetical protein
MEVFFLLNGWLKKWSPVKALPLQFLDERQTWRCFTNRRKWSVHRDMHPAMPVKSRLLRCLSFGPNSAHGDVAHLLLGWMSFDGHSK